MVYVVLLILNHDLLRFVNHVQESLQVLITRRLHAKDGEPLVTIAGAQTVDQLLEYGLDGELALVLDHVNLLFLELALVLRHDVVQRSIHLHIDHLVANVFYYLVVDELAVAFANVRYLIGDLAREPIRSSVVGVLLL